MNKIITEIRKLEKEKDYNSLGSFLIDLVKYGENPIQYENEFKKHLDSSDWYLRKVSVYALLFKLNIENPAYRKRAIDFIKDKSEDYEVRSWSAVGLAETYQNTKDKELLKLFIEIMDSPIEDEFLKNSMLRSTLSVFGLTAREQLLRNEDVLPEFDQNLRTFKTEIIEIKELIK